MQGHVGAFLQFLMIPKKLKLMEFHQVHKESLACMKNEAF